MGLSIHYSGRIKDAASLPLLIEDVRDISKIYGWKHNVYESSFPDNILDNQEHLEPVYGISFTPTECETVFFNFLSNGIMVCPTRIVYFGNSKSEIERNYIYHTSVKTQYAGMVTHSVVINMFKYLNNKYLLNFNMSDDSQYWETGDEELLQRNFKAYEALLDNFVLSMQTFPVKNDESMISYFERLLKHINKLKNQ